MAAMLLIPASWAEGTDNAVILLYHHVSDSTLLLQFPAVFIIKDSPCVSGFIVPFFLGFSVVH